MSAYGLFEVFGVEVEWMVADRLTLDVRPLADAVLRGAAGLPGAAVVEAHDGQPAEVDLGGGVTVGNELTAHVLEFKVSRPVRGWDLSGLAGVPTCLDGARRRLEPVLDGLGVTLLPSGAHPWMDPWNQMRLWEHGNREVYRAFDRIFDCRGHGWANLQSTHLNLPFAGGGEDGLDGEFGRLHASVRAVLPLLPALSASTPFLEGAWSGALDGRLEVYRGNSRALPEAAGRVIPEGAYTRGSYESAVLEPLRAALSRVDPAGVLEPEWTNSRGAIARFTRGSIEVRVLDAQECPSADVGICFTAARVIEALAAGRAGPVSALRALDVEPLHDLLLSVIREGDRAIVRDGSYLRALGVGELVEAGSVVGAVWAGLVDRWARGTPGWGAVSGAVETILREGPLSRRILARTGLNPSRERLRAVYGELAACLSRDRMLA